MARKARKTRSTAKGILGNFDGYGFCAEKYLNGATSRTTRKERMRKLKAIRGYAG